MKDCEQINGKNIKKTAGASRKHVLVAIYSHSGFMWNMLNLVLTLQSTGIKL